ncbi:MAG: cobalamin B12-binding domain-containing protein [Gammaproteobacteria bacterium]|nr:MAG: cobalamin B12-binding domain-containing protein [Gammaproteobacteria bacterium]
MTDEQGKRLITLLADMEEEPALALARQMLDAGYDPLQMLALCRQAMDIVGARYEAEEYFLTELMLAGEMLTEISAMARPLIIGDAGAAESAARASVVIGTVKGDLHDIGKNIVSFMLEIAGYRVIDLGVDVPAQRFLEAIRANRPAVVGLSGFLTLAFDSMKDIIESFREAGVRGDFKVMIGGGQVDERVCEFTHADAFGRSAVEAVALCNDWTGPRP